MINSATLDGTVILNFLQTTVEFEYGTSDQYGSISAATPATSDGFSLTRVNTFISGLKMGEQYHFRIKAVNSSRTAYGKDTKFMTLSETITDVEGNVYYTVKIGSQTWMASNLGTTKYNDGTEIPMITDGSIWSGQTSGGYCWYNNDQNLNKNTYGGLYNWYAVNTGKLCPTGWHVTMDSEIENLISFLGGEEVAGGKLKEQGLIHWYSHNVGATNETSFFGFPGGGRDYYSGSFYRINGLGKWWSAFEVTDKTAKSMFLLNYNSSASRAEGSKNYGYSVRCISDI